MLHLTGPVLVGDGEVRPRAWVVDGRITFAPPAGAEHARPLDGVAVPGLVDAHCHIGLGPDGPVSRAEAEAQARVVRDTGVLLVRDAGSPGDTGWVQRRPDLPVLIRAGQHLARPKRYLRGFARELHDVAELPEAVAAEARAGDGWVKLVADWIDRAEGAEADLRPLWPADVLRDAIAAAHENGARVTAHTFSHEAAGPLIDAGIDCLEHGTGLDADQMAECAARGIAVVPTLLQVSRFDDIAAQAGAKYPVYAEHMLRMHARRYAHVAALHDAGVPLLMGSDAGGSIDHGVLPAELAEVGLAGVPAADVVAAASWRARAFLGQPGLAEGAPADVVVYDADPRAELSVLARPAAVILRGEVVHAPAETVR